MWVYSNLSGNNFVLVNTVQCNPCFNMKPKSIFITVVEKLSSYKKMIRDKGYTANLAIIFL